MSVPLDVHETYPLSTLQCSLYCLLIYDRSGSSYNLYEGPVRGFLVFWHMVNIKSFVLFHHSGFGYIVSLK